MRKLVSIFAPKTAGAIILDPFAGSGTTLLAAKQAGIDYIGIESGSHIDEYVSRRLKLVIEGEQGGISKDVGWSGGGAFEFYRASLA